MSDSDDFSYLPPTLAEIAQVAGLAAALKLMHAQGGVRVGIPKRAPDGHWLVELIGREAADRLGAHFAGGRVLIPMSDRSRVRKAAALLAEGKSLDYVARHARLHVRHVSRIKARVRTERQGSLF